MGTLRKIGVSAAMGLGVGVAFMALAGPLSPPGGAVSSTYKTLTEVEPRTPISTATTPGDADSLYSISRPGSYYLLANVVGVNGKAGIELLVSDVTIDLCGFEVTGVAGSTSGIVTRGPGLTNISVLNGSLRSWPNYGINFRDSWATGGTISDVHAHGCSVGIGAGRGMTIARCAAVDCSGTGIMSGESSTVRDSSAIGSGFLGFHILHGAVATNCAATGCDLAGFRVFAGSVSASSSYLNAGIGIEATSGCVVRACHAYQNGNHGIVAEYGCSIVENTCDSNRADGGTAAGILVKGLACRVERNHCANNDRGIEVDGNQSRIDDNSCMGNSVSFDIDGIDNLLVRNSATGGSPNYSIVAGNSVAPRVSVTDSDGWSGIANADHPWANVGY